jgi:pyruvate,water dikinase
LFKLPFVFLKQWRSATRQAQIGRVFARHFETEVVPPFVAEADRAAAEDWGRKTDQELLDALRYWIQRALVDFARDSLKPTALAGLAMGNLERALAQRFQPPGTASRWADGAAKAQEALRQLVMGVRLEEATDLPGALRALQAGGITEDEFVRRFGHRGSAEMELSRPRWSEDAAGRASLGAAPAATPAPAKDAPDWQTVWTAIADEAKLAPHQRPAVEAELRTLQNYLRLRESAKHYLLKGYALIRRALVELDRRHELHGDIFYLLPDELPKLITGGPAVRDELRQLAAGRKRRREIALSLPAPQVLFSDDLDAIGREVEVSAADVMQGMPLSAGVAEAPAWVLHEVGGSPPSDEPYILVCPSTDPAWVPLFVQARGLVMETGGVLSHGAIVAREFGLPAVAGIADVHRRLKTGQRLRVDGATGRVSVLDA